MLFKKYWEKSYRIRVVEAWKLGEISAMDDTESKLMDNRKGLGTLGQLYRGNRTKRIEISTIIYITESKAKQIQCCSVACVYVLLDPFWILLCYIKKLFN